MSKTNVEVHMKLERTAEMTVMMKCYLCLHNFSELLKFIFLVFHWKVFLVLSETIVYIFSF